MESASPAAHDPEHTGGFLPARSSVHVVAAPDVVRTIVAVLMPLNVMTVCDVVEIEPSPPIVATVFPSVVIVPDVGQAGISASVGVGIVTFFVAVVMSITARIDVVPLSVKS
jgi:hypothetical protein